MVKFKRQIIREKTSKLSVENHFKNAKRLLPFAVNGSLEIWSRNPIMSKNRSLVRIIKKVEKKGVQTGRIGIAFDKYEIGRKMPAIHFDLVYYPKLEHIHNFKDAVKSRRSLGPGEKFKGAVGSINLRLLTRGYKKVLHIGYIQAHFKTGVEVSRSLASKYGGWRKHLLNTLFEIVETEKITRINYLDLNPIAFGEEEAKSINNRFDEFKKIAESNGFIVQRNFISSSTSAEIVATKA